MYTRRQKNLELKISVFLFIHQQELLPCSSIKNKKIKQANMGSVLVLYTISHNRSALLRFVFRPFSLFAIYKVDNLSSCLYYFVFIQIYILRFGFLQSSSGSFLLMVTNCILSWFDRDCIYCIVPTLYLI